MTFALVVLDHGHPHGTPGQALFGEQFALEELIVLAISPTVIWNIPAVDHTPMLQIGDRLDPPVDCAIDGDEHPPDIRGQSDDLRFRWINRTFARPAPAKVDPGRGWIGLPGSGQFRGGRQSGEGLRLTAPVRPKARLAAMRAIAGTVMRRALIRCVCDTARPTRAWRM